MQIASCEINFIRRLIAESRVNPLLIVEVHIVLDAEAQLRQTDVLLDFDILVLQRPPETLHLGIIQAAPPAVHADFDAIIPQFANKLGTGELAPLV